MNYLVAVLRDRVQLEAAYRALEEKGISPEKFAIFGQGYQSAEDYGLIDPREQAKKQATLMAIWVVPFGFVAGFAFNFITGLNTFPWAGEIGNRIIGGLLGAAAGAMGSYFIGGGVGLAIGGRDALPYRDLLKAGKYLLLVRGSELLTRKATDVLQQVEPETIQGYSDTTDI
jgi:hypothetical protein